MRITQLSTLKKLAQICELMGLQCAYDTDGKRKPYDELRSMIDSGLKVHALDHQPAYGGARLHTYSNGFGLSSCDSVFAAYGINTGISKRQKLRDIYWSLEAIELAYELKKAAQ